MKNIFLMFRFRKGIDFYQFSFSQKENFVFSARMNIVYIPLNVLEENLLNQFFFFL